jgi:hypothetical protein
MRRRRGDIRLIDGLIGRFDPVHVRRKITRPWVSFVIPWIGTIAGPRTTTTAGRTAIIIVVIRTHILVIRSIVGLVESPVLLQVPVLEGLLHQTHGDATVILEPPGMTSRQRESEEKGG